MPAARHNAFISYAWVDNRPFEPAQSGWVSTFVDGLRKHLGRELGRKELGDRVWLDYEKLRGSDSIKGIIQSELESTHLLVPILSRGYLDSPWCRQELKAFLELHGADSGRIFPVWMSPAEVLPPELDALLKYKFWYEDGARKPRTRWFPDRDPTDRDYGRMGLGHRFGHRHHSGIWSAQRTLQNQSATVGSAVRTERLAETMTKAAVCNRTWRVTWPLAWSISWGRRNPRRYRQPWRLIWPLPPGLHHPAPWY